MDYQPMNQPAGNPVPPMEPMNQPAQKSMMKNYVVLGVVALVLIILAIWYFSQPVANNTPPQQQSAQSSAAAQDQLPPLSSGNTTAAIANDLSQIPDDSAALTQSQNSLDQNIQSL